jgi:hypothetical protein
MYRNPDVMYSYFVYEYKYSTDARSHWGAKRITHYQHDLDTLPPTVLQLHTVRANNRKEALDKVRCICGSNV